MYKCIFLQLMNPSLPYRECTWWHYGSLIFMYMVPLWYFSINVHGTIMVLKYLLTWYQNGTSVFTYMVPPWFFIIYERGATIVLYHLSTWYYCSTLIFTYFRINVSGSTMVLYYLLRLYDYGTLVFTYVVPLWYFIIHVRDTTVLL